MLGKTKIICLLTVGGGKGSLNYDIAIITEADEYVASGHLKECEVFAEELVKRNFRAVIWINDDIPEGFLKGMPERYYMYSRPIEKGIDTIISYLKKHNIKLLILNLRKVDNELILRIKQAYDVEILCIDEFGHRRLDCDIIVNPMVDKNFGCYTGNYKQLFVGNQYLILPQKYYEWHKKEKLINKEIQQITISMGGVDRNNTTQKIVEWLQKIEIQNIKINVVLGGGYRLDKSLGQVVKSKDIQVFCNINFLDELFFDSDLAFCAGGNTLHELSCIGTPSIVIPSMPHEYRNGKTFESKGFGKCYWDFAMFEKEVAKEFLSIFNFEERVSQMKAGKSCSDGAGYLRMIDLITKKIEKC